MLGRSTGYVGVPVTNVDRLPALFADSTFRRRCIASFAAPPDFGVLGRSMLKAAVANGPAR